MDDRSRVQVTGPLAPLANDFATWLASVGYTPGSTAMQLRRMARLSEWMATAGVGVSGVNSIVVELFLADRHARGHSLALRVGGFDQLRTFLRNRGLVGSPTPVDPMPESAAASTITRFARYLAVERGLAARTITRYLPPARAFLDGAERDGVLDLEPVTAQTVIEFVVDWSRRYPHSTSHLASPLRSLLRFLQVEGMIGAGLAAAVPSVAHRRLAGLPNTLSAGEVAALLAACDATTTVGVRDRAILTVLSRLGLRVGEAVALRLDDIDWRRGEITIRGKSNRHEVLPLPVDVGEAIVSYLVEVRPVTDAREVFLCVRAPYRAMSRNGMSNRAAAAARRAGLPTVYAHQLRHSAATAMLAGGASLDEIGQVLRHRPPADHRDLRQGRHRGLARAGASMARGDGMNALSDALADYLAVRRAMGFWLDRAEKLLGQFIDYLEQHDAEVITIEHALAWATQPNATPWWHRLPLSAVRGFARYLHTLDPSTEVPPPDLIPARHPRATPYLYSDSEIRAVIVAARGLAHPVPAAIYPVLIGLLAVTGIRIGEATALETTDFDQHQDVLTVRSGKFGKARLLPLHPSTADALRDYRRVRDQLLPIPVTGTLFVSTAGTRLDQSHVSKIFNRLTRQAGLVPRSASCRPRIHDLRHSFAVATILDSYRCGGDVPAVLPRLATYLGHSDPKDTYWYLDAAPELLAFAANLLQTYTGA
ncbi:MAG TPA: tyrosine-type recombinase/integrase [Mycobacterium sp.]